MRRTEQENAPPQYRSSPAIRPSRVLPAAPQQPGYPPPARPHPVSAAAYGQQPGYPPPPPGYAQRSPYAPPPPARGTPFRMGPSPWLQGTVLQVRTTDALDNKRAKEGTPLDFTVIRDVTVNGWLAIPRGATVHGVVTESKNAGELKRFAGTGPAAYVARPGRKELSARFRRVQGEGSSKTGRTAGNIIGGALLGAIIGGAAGGGGGAAIGAAAGGTVGTAASAAIPDRMPGSRPKPW